MTPWKISSVETQIDFLIELNYQLEKAKKWAIELLFFDPCHQLHNTIIWKCWQPKGKNWTIVLNSNTWRKRINILWWINALTMQFNALITERSCNTETVKEVLYNIRNEYRNWKKIVIILDNASYNHSKEVKILTEKLGIKLLFLPPYSPNLNLIERVWKFLKKVLKNKYTPNFTDFVEKINNTCWEFNSIFKEKLSSLLNNKIQIIRG